MKQDITILRALFICLSIFLLSNINAPAQTSVTKFMGIPVTGSKTQMIQKLKAKGFKNSKTVPGCLEGQFNGRHSQIAIVTNHNKVYRVMVMDTALFNESEVKSQYTNLCSQFWNNPKYIFVDGQNSIPYTDDISYEMSVNNKSYQIAFYQRTKTDSEITSLERERCKDRLVWISVIEEPLLYKHYRIAIYYDNLKNAPNGEDL